MTVKIITPSEAVEITKKIRKGREDCIASMVNDIITYYAKMGETSYVVPLTNIDLSDDGYDSDISFKVAYTFIKEDDVYTIQRLFREAGYTANLKVSFVETRSLFFWRRKSNKKYSIEVSHNG